MNKIKQIKLKNFKFFFGEVTIDLERNHALIFGENGSKKSSFIGPYAQAYFGSQQPK
jgi:chromosome segregation ATPase